jgi:hypothetical protein
MDGYAQPAAPVHAYYQQMSGPRPGAVDFVSNVPGGRLEMPQQAPTYTRAAKSRVATKAKKMRPAGKAATPTRPAATTPAPNAGAAQP